MKAFIEIFKNKTPKNLTRPELTKDKVAELLNLDPEYLKAFEDAYEKNVLNAEPEDFFTINSRQAAQKNAKTNGTEDAENITNLKERIVRELLAQTEVFTFNGKNASVYKPLTLPAGEPPVQNTEIKHLPEHLQPQLSGHLIKKDFDVPTYPHLLYFYEKYLNEKDKKKSRDAYNMFRQGLDILDLDSITYEIIGTNPNSMGFWFPELIKACEKQDFFKIPKTTIVKVPITLLQLTRLEYAQLTQTTFDIVNEWALKAFKLDKDADYFIKTGTYSSKFDFRNAYVHEEKEVGEIGEYLLYIHHQALQMAGPLTIPCVYGVSTTNEWVVREFIQDTENNPCIYKGLPLHTEYRVFIDCDRKKVLSVVPYWEPETMKQRFGHEEDADSPHQIHDYIIYKAHEEKLMGRYNENKNLVLNHVEAILPSLNLSGQWSLDIMQNGEAFWLIDMAKAENSAFYESIPEALRMSSKENWFPELQERSRCLL